jgi:hypothetical protein
MDDSPKSDWAYLNQRRHSLKERALANRLYQQARQRIHELREGIVKAASLAAGSVALANVSAPSIVQWAAAVITVGTSASLVFGWGAKSRDASRRAADWTLLERDIEAAGERRFSETQLDTWAARCNEIEAGEPAQNKILFERCSIQAAKALGAESPIKSRFGWPVIVP